MRQLSPTACGRLLSCATIQEMLCWKLQPCTSAVALMPSLHRCLLPAADRRLTCCLFEDTLICLADLPSFRVVYHRGQSTS